MSEAKDLLHKKTEELKLWSYRDLMQLMNPQNEVVVGSSGVEYQIESEAFWDDKKKGNLRVMVSIDDASWRSLAPVSDDFIVGPDGRFVGE